MDMRRKIALLLGLLLFVSVLSGCSALTSSSSSGKSSSAKRAAVTAKMYQADYWTGKVKDAGKTLLSASEIEKVNALISETEETGVADLVTYPSSLTTVQLRRYLNAVPMPSGDLYDAEGTKFEDSFYDELIASMNTGAIDDTNKVSYAIALYNTTLRTFPVLTAGYEDPKSPDVDVFQLGQVLVGDPLIILHTNADDTWYFVQTRTQRGWIRSDLIVFMEKGSWVNYISTSSFLIVTGPSITLEDNPFAESLSGVTLYMGTKLLLYSDEKEFDELYRRGTDGCYVAKYPTIDRFGYLEYQPVLIPYSEDVSEGYLPYTPENLIRQALKMTGKRIAVNRVGGGRDNAAFVQDLYAVFGIFMPATAAGQRAVPANETDFSDILSAERKTNLEKLSPGTLLFSDDRAFLYLGTDNKNPYVITTVDEYYFDDERYIANATVITGLDIVKRDGTVFIDTLETAKVLGEIKESADDKKDEAESKDDKDSKQTTTATTKATKATTPTTTAKEADSTTKADSDKKDSGK